MSTLLFGLRLLAELIPLFLAVSFIVYIAVDSITPERIQKWFTSGSRYSKVPLAVGLGAITPFCSCSTVPLVNGMRLAGVPTAPLVAFLLGSPLVSPVAFVLLWGALGARYAMAYVTSAMILSAVAAIVVERWHGAMPALGDEVDVDAATNSGASCNTTAEGSHDDGSMDTQNQGHVVTLGAPRMQSKPALLERMGNAWARSTADLRKLAAPLLFAVALGAVVHGYVPDDLLGSMAGPTAVLAVPIAAIAGIPVYASVVVLLPLATTLLGKGVGIGAVTAFLMAASGFSVPEGLLLSKVLPNRLLWRILVAFAIAVVVIGYAFQMASSPVS